MSSYRPEFTAILPHVLADIMEEYIPLVDVIQLYPKRKQELLKLYDNEYHQLDTINRELTSRELDMLFAHLILEQDAPLIGVNIYITFPEYIRELLLLYQSNLNLFSAYVESEFESSAGETCFPPMFKQIFFDRALTGKQHIVISSAIKHNCSDVFKWLGNHPLLVSEHILAKSVEGDISLRDFTALLKGSSKRDLTEVLVTLISGIDPRTNKLEKYIDIILGMGVDINAVSRRGQTALTAAVSSGSENIAAYLLERGANPNIRDAENPLIMATLRNNPAMIRLLMRHGVDPNRRSYTGETAMMQAQRYNYVAAINALAEFSMTDEKPLRERSTQSRSSIRRRSVLSQSSESEEKESPNVSPIKRRGISPSLPPSQRRFTQESTSSEEGSPRGVVGGRRRRQTPRLPPSPLPQPSPLRRQVIRRPQYNESDESSS